MHVVYPSLLCLSHRTSSACTLFFAMHASSPSHSTMLGLGGTTPCNLCLGEKWEVNKDKGKTEPGRDLWLDWTCRVRLNAQPPSVPHWKKRDCCTNSVSQSIFSWAQRVVTSFTGVIRWAPSFNGVSITGPLSVRNRRQSAFSCEAQL